MKTMDGNNLPLGLYPFTELAAIYPITPSSVMAEVTDQWSAKGQTNIFDQPVTVVELQPKLVLLVQCMAHFLLVH